MRLGKDSEQRCLAHLRQANNASFHDQVSVLGFQFSEESGMTYKDKSSVRPEPRVSARSQFAC
jgi:hypothetical protein